MIKIFNATDKTYSSNGDIVLNPTKASIHKEDNGAFYFDLETPLTEKEINKKEAEIGETIEGTSFQIDVDVKKQYQVQSLLGNTEQDGTPTPSSPIAIETVTGRQVINICGKNLFNIGSSISDYFATDYNGIRIDSAVSIGNYVTATFENEEITINSYNNSGYRWLSKMVYLKNNTTYTLSSNSLPTQIKIVGFNSLADNTTGTELVLINNLTLKPPRTFNSGNYKYYVLSIYPQKANNVFSDIMLETGSTASTYEAYNGNEYELNLGKNLFDYTTATFSTPTNVNIVAEDNILTITTTRTTTSGDLFFRTKIPDNSLENGATYTLSSENVSGVVQSLKLQLRNKDGSYASGQSQADSVVYDDTYSLYIVRNIFASDNSTSIAEGTIAIIKNIQVEKGSATSSYSAYKTPIELCKIGTYQDRIFYNIEDSPYYDSNLNEAWYIHKEIGEVVLDGSDDEAWSYLNNYDDNYLYQSLGISVDIENYSTNYLCSHALPNSTSSSSGNIGSYVFNKAFRLRVPSSIATTSGAFKTWLSSNNVEVYYALATSTNTEITDTELLDTLDSIRLLSGTNNISITCADLPAIMNLHYNFVSAKSNTIKYIDYLIPNNILVANTPQGEQAFRITNVEKNRRKIKIKANHVFYDSGNYLIEDSYVVDKNCNDALDHLNSATSDLSPFTTISNVTNINSFRCVRKSLYEAINTVLERWGGHLVRNNWSIGIYDEIGEDNGVTIRYAKNLKEITATYNWDGVVTKLLPVGKDGILLNDLDNTQSLYVESVTQYDIPYTKTISFEQNDVNEEDYKDDDGNLIENDYKQALINDLYNKATAYVSENSIPKVNYSLKANLEKISDVGDRVEVIDEKLGINLMTRVISYDYDCLLEKYTNLEFGNFMTKLSDLFSNINSNTEKIIDEKNSTLKVTLGEELNEATSKIWSALGDSYVIYDGDKILVVDTLPKEDATNVIMINAGGIAFSNSGITGTFTSAWTIDNILNMEAINVINLTADLIKGGTLKLGSNLNQNGQIEVYDASNTLISELNKDGLKMYGADGSYVLMNNTVGFAGFDRNNNKIYWVDQDEFHMKKSVVEEEITLVNKMRIIPITITNNGTIVNDGIGFVNVGGDN